MRPISVAMCMVRHGVPVVLEAKGFIAEKSDTMTLPNHPTTQHMMFAPADPDVLNKFKKF